MEVYIFPFLFILGAIIGSFLNVCIYRIPRKESIVFPSSHCPSCNRAIEYYDNIPIVSYILLRGRCRYCGERISIQYPVVEIITGILLVALLKRFDIGLKMPILFIFIAALLVISLIDLKHRIIPNQLSLGFIVIGLILSPFLHGPVESITGILVGGGLLFSIAYIYQLLTHREGMGGGDVQLLAMIGAFRGGKGAVFSLFAGSLTGTIIGIFIMVLKGGDRRYAIPFGPFLSLGALVYIFWGEKIIMWYLGWG